MGIGMMAGSRLDERHAKDYTIAAVDRAIAVLEALGARSEQGVTEVAKSTGLTKSLAFRLLQTLEARGFVVREPNNSTYSLGYRVGVLGERIGHNGSLLFAARPVMERLRDKTSETVNLVVREGTRSLNLANQQGHHSMRLYSHIGHGPLHAGGGSLVMLAHSDESILEQVLSAPLDRCTETTVIDPFKLRHLLERIRDSGYNVAINDMVVGAFSVGAPIRGGHGDVIAAISVAGASVRFNEETRALIIHEVVAAASEITQKLSLHRDVA